MVRVLTEDDRMAYDKQAGHLMQSWVWGEFREKLGTDIVRQGEFKDGKLVQGWQASIHKLPFVSKTIGYLPKGPVPTPMLLGALSDLGKKKSSIFFQLEPNVKEGQMIPQKILRPSARPLFTKHNFLIDLTQNEDQLFAKMHPKTRYNIRLAQRKGVTITVSQSEAAFKNHLSLYISTAKRQHYFGHDKTYHQTLWETIREPKMAYFVQAILPVCQEHNPCLLASWMVIRWQDTIYYPYGGSSENHREMMGSNLVAWDTILLGKKLGCRTLDLWGALGPNPDPTDPWYGFHRFKTGYGGNHITYCGSFDLVLQNIHYLLFVTANKLRWFFLSHL